MGREENEELYGGLSRADSAYWKTRRTPRANLARITEIASQIKRPTPIENAVVQVPRVDSEEQLAEARKTVDFASSLKSKPELLYADTDAKREFLEKKGYRSLPFNGKKIPLKECDAISIGRAFYQQFSGDLEYIEMMSKLS